MFSKLTTALLLSCLFLFKSGDLTKVENNSRRIISDGEHKYEFHITSEKIAEYHLNKRYFWFKNSKINFSNGGSNGDLLHGSYTKSFLDNHLAEQGDFEYGLKVDQWKKWHNNGQLLEVVNWKNGLKNGDFLQYSEQGEIVLAGVFSEGRKTGMWIDFIDKDTLYYKKGERIDSPKERKLKKEEARKEKGKFTERVGKFFKKIFPPKKEKKNKGSSSKKSKKTKKVKKTNTSTKS